MRFINIEIIKRPWALILFLASFSILHLSRELIFLVVPANIFRNEKLNKNNDPIIELFDIKNWKIDRKTNLKI